MVLHPIMGDSGAVEAEWSATLVGVKRRRRYKDSEEEMPFFIKRTSALFPPKTAELIEIGFIPTKERLYETMLKLEVKHNPEKMTVQLIGSGVEPRVFLDPLTVQFGAHVPYSGIVQRELIVSNKCNFNIELYFPDFDSAILEEDRVLRVLTHLYNSDKLLLPLDLYDTALSEELKEFYKKLVDYAREISKSNLEATENIAENSSTGVSSISQRKLSKNELNTSRDEKTSDVESDSFVPPSHPLSLMSLDGIENHLHGLIDDSSVELGGSSDPLELKERTVPLPALDAKDPNKGILLAFHGAPKTDCVYWANRTANKLLLSVKTLDQVILEEAAGSDRLAAVTVQQAVYDSYMELAVDLDAVETVSEVGAGVNYDELCKRVLFLSTAKAPPILVDEKKKGAGGKKSPKPKTAVKTDSPATFRDIPVEVFVDLIKDRLLEEVEMGLVLVNLTGFFLKLVKPAVSVILKCVGHISCLDFVTLFNTHTHNLMWKTKCQQKKDMIQKMMEEEKMVLFDEMSREQLMELSAEDQLMFEKTVLEDRKQLLNKLRGRERQTSLPASPAGTIATKSKKDDKKSKKQSVGASEKSKDTKTTVKGKNKSSTLPSPTNLKSKQSSLKSSKLQKQLGLVDEIEDDAALEAQFACYQQELEELVTLLSRWNKTTKEFEDLDRLPSLFSVPKPQTKKGKKPSAKPDISNNRRTSGTNIGVNCNIIKFPLNPTDTWFGELTKFKANRETFLTSKKVEKEWFEISLPHPLTLASVKTPEIRTGNTDLGYFKILDGKFTELEIGVSDDDVTDETEQVVDVEDSQQEEEENSDEIISEKSAHSVASSFQFKTSKSENSIKSERDATVEEVVIQASGDSASTTESKKSGTSVSTPSTDETVEEKFTARINLEPGEKRSWRVFFDPKKLAVYHQTLQLEIGGWRKRYNVFLSATCDIPHIDNNPTAIFKKKNTVIVVPASRLFSKLQNGGALPMPLPVLPDTNATDKLTRRFSSFADCEWNCCAYVVKLVFDILGRCVVCTRNGLRKETIYVCETCTARPNLHPDTCFKTYHTLTLP
ncbi:hypothetical protein J6590_085162 [Homalodisca vitripennis]|nr:hypothetical protein J6590_085162 [Homalodisca vitripennis]